MPFDRLVRLVDEANAQEMFSQSIFAQIGGGSYKPTTFEFVDFLSHQKYMQMLSDSDALISHAGIGSINAALKADKPMLVMPRRKDHAELVDDHQVQTAQIFSRLGHVLVFENLTQLKVGLRALPEFKPKPRTPNRVGISREIQNYVDSRFIGQTSESTQP